MTEKSKRKALRSATNVDVTSPGCAHEDHGSPARHQGGQNRGQSRFGVGVELLLLSSRKAPFEMVNLDAYHRVTPSALSARLTIMFTALWHLLTPCIRSRVALSECCMIAEITEFMTRTLLTSRAVGPIVA